MHKLLSLLLASALVFSALSPARSARAVEIKASGSMEILFESAHNIHTGNQFQNYADNGNHQKHFAAVQRLILGLDFTVSEYLSAHYEAQAGAFTWGGPSSGNIYNAGSGNGEESRGGALGSRAANIATRTAYLDWMAPGTDLKIRMGQQWISLPGYAFPSPVLSHRGTAIVASMPLADSARLTAFWLRAYSDSRRGSSGAAAPIDDTMDLFSLTADFRPEGFRITPWIMAGKLGGDVVDFNRPFNQIYVNGGLLPVTGYAVFGRDPKGGVANLGTDSSNSTLLFGGLSLEMTRFDPLRLAVDAYWSGSDNRHSSTERSGWYAGASAEYRTAFGVPTFKAWYASGDNDNAADGSERPLSVHSGFTPGAPVLFNSFAYGLSDTSNRGEAGGTWGVSAQWNEASFLKGMFHSLRATYVQGTNSPAMAPYASRIGLAQYLTTKDRAVEIDLDTTCSIYDNLAALLELSYVFQNFDGKVWRGLPGTNGDRARFSDAWRAGLTLTYTF